MKDDRADPRCAPGVVAAVAWLMASEGEDEVSLLRKARLRGLLRQGRAGSLWKCDGPLLARLLSRRIRSGKLPKRGAVLLGIGEMIARGHAPEGEIEQSFVRLFRHAYPEAARLRLLRQALDVVASKAHPQKSSSSIYKKDELSIMDWTQVTFADRWMQHPAPLGARARYGLNFVARILLRSDPARLKWFAKEAGTRGLLSAIVGSVGQACSWDEDAPRRALRSGVPLFVGFGVAALRDGEEDGKGWKASTVNAALIDSKTSVEGRMYVSAMMLKEAVHAWHRQKDRPSNNRRKRAILKIDPRQAVGGERYADDEINRLTAEEPVLETRRTAVMLALDDALQTAAQQDINPVKLWSIFEPSLVDTPEIEHRFAMAHPNGLLRSAALGQALSTFDKLVGIRHPETIIREKFNPVRAERELAFWAAQSQVKLSEASGSDTGRDAARKIGKAEEALRNFTLQPFAASRFQDRFQNALGRWSVLLQFAFLVALSDQERPLVRLRDEALKSAALFLPLAGRSAYDPKWSDAVADLTADALLSMEAIHARQWVGNERQPVLVRAQLAWTHPAILDENLQLAISLIDKIAAQKSTPAHAGRNASCLLNIVDRASVAMLTADRSDLFIHLEAPFSRAVEQADAPLARSVSIETVLAALDNDSDASTVLLEDPVWGHTRLSEALRHRKSKE